MQCVCLFRVYKCIYIKTYEKEIYCNGCLKSIWMLQHSEPELPSVRMPFQSVADSSVLHLPCLWFLNSTRIPPGGSSAARADLDHKPISFSSYITLLCKEGCGQIHQHGAEQYKLSSRFYYSACKLYPDLHHSHRHSNKFLSSFLVTNTIPNKDLFVLLLLLFFILNKVYIDLQGYSFHLVNLL